jgi:RimJ/RimL family protein N-acetyltransferase
VEAYCFAENEPSWRLMERVGMRREAHTVADGLHRDGTWRDGLAYALLAWAAREGLVDPVTGAPKRHQA